MRVWSKVPLVSGVREKSSVCGVLVFNQDLRGCKQHSNGQCTHQGTHLINPYASTRENLTMTKKSIVLSVKPLEMYKLRGSKPIYNWEWPSVDYYDNRTIGPHNPVSVRWPSEKTSMRYIDEPYRKKNLSDPREGMQRYKFKMSAYNE